MIVLLTTPGCPCMDHILELEKEEEIITQAKGPHPFNGRPAFVVMPRNSGCNVTAIPISEAEPFSRRVLFPEAWAGKRDRELDQAVGISGCIFAHSGRFMVEHTTLNGAIEMAKLALKAAGYL
ncbi:unnamed protein product [Dibothriocephalus latus]|uniref:Uncharacterized protein n=1 Tax=Dibothriocephalus latus TaxID=60516 RepID=A0A3P7PHE8_DIBLA|nr:unnamed protein product [Dibothriocephalus latus]